MAPDLILGIDIGTTSVKVAVVEAKSKYVLVQLSKDTESHVPFCQSMAEHHPEGDLQDPNKILAAVHECVNQERIHQ
jgi:sugar (pentulose or hexulose) kinase